MLNGADGKVVSHSWVKSLVAIMFTVELGYHWDIKAKGYNKYVGTLNRSSGSIGAPVKLGVHFIFDKRNSKRSDYRFFSIMCFQLKCVMTMPD